MWAQSPAYNIKHFYTPDIVRNRMEFNLNADTRLLGFWNDNNIYGNGTVNEAEFTGHSTLNFTRFASTRKLSSIFGIGGTFDADILVRDQQHTSANFPTLNTSQNKRTLNSDNSFGMYWNNKRYFPSKCFLIYNLNANFRFDIESLNSNQNSNSTETRDKYATMYVAPALGAGHGRIEAVQDARHALYIVDALKAKGVLSRDLTREEIFSFAQTISSVKNKRFLDSRLHRIEEITTVDAYLKENRMLAKDDVTYFSTLYDMWQYGDLFERKSGHELAFTLSPRGYWSKWDKTTINENENNLTNDYARQYGGFASLTYELEKPIKNNWQLSVRYGLEVGRIINWSEWTQNSITQENTSHITRTSAFTNYSLGFYPNTRTYLVCNIGGNYNLYGPTGGSSWSRNNWTSLNTTAYYYISPQLRVSGSWSMQNAIFEDTTYPSKRITGNFSTTITYAFF